LQAFWPLQALLADLQALWPLQALTPLQSLLAICALAMVATSVLAANIAAAVAMTIFFCMMPSLDIARNGVFAGPGNGITQYVTRVKNETGAPPMVRDARKLGRPAKAGPAY
jgi:hypothetical protein